MFVVGRDISSAECRRILDTFDKLFTVSVLVYGRLLVENPKFEKISTAKWLYLNQCSVNILMRSSITGGETGPPFVEATRWAAYFPTFVSVVKHLPFLIQRLPQQTTR